MRKSIRKKKLVLPSDYQEVLISNEIELANKISVDVIRKLVYLYTIGMDYYNISGKCPLEKFYNDKLISLLTRQDVADFLDKNKVDLDSNNDLNLFNEESLEENGKTRYSVFFHEKDQEETSNHTPVIDKKDLEFDNIRRKTVYNKDNSDKKKEKEMKQKIKDQVSKVDAKLTKINENISQSIVSQMSAFEDKRRQKQTLNPKNSNTKISFKSIQSMKSAKSEDQDDNIAGERFSFNHQDSEIANEQRPLRKRRVSIGQNLMHKEVEVYVEKNMNDMFIALDELKKTFESEIAEAESNGFPDIAESLREDMKSELDNLKDQFEEQRRIETEKIRGKFKKSGSFYRSSV